MAWQVPETGIWHELPHVLPWSWQGVAGTMHSSVVPLKSGLVMTGYVEGGSISTCAAFRVRAFSQAMLQRWRGDEGDGFSLSNGQRTGLAQE